MYAEQRERIKRVSGVHLSVDGHYQFSKPMGIYSSEIKDGKEKDFFHSTSDAE